MVWTLALFAVAVLLAIQAMASLYDAQQECFFHFPAVPCPGADDPSVARLTFAFIGVPAVWLLGTGLVVVVWTIRRHGSERR